MGASEQTTPLPDAVHDRPIPRPEQFSALELRDRVVIMLLFDQIVSEERVAEVWSLWKQQAMGQPQEPLWRFLTLIPELDRDLIFGEVARVYGIEEVRMNRRIALPLIERMHRNIPGPLWEEMVELRVLPVSETTQHHSHRHRVIFATHDPMHPATQELMPKLNIGGYELRYAPEKEVIDLLVESFPWKYEALREAIEKEQELLISTTPELEEASPEPAVAPEPTSEVEAISEALEEELLAARVNSSSILSFFEDMLVQAVRHNVAGVCIAPNEHGEVEVFFQQEEGLEQWRVVDHIDQNALLATIKSAVIRADFGNQKDTQREVIKRWIDGKLIRFRVSALPANEQFNLESIVVRVMR
ncbi:MAG: hypothetical protein ACE5G0_20855 [Rhodothermales bacterium]